jgi:hypothetical protein
MMFAHAAILLLAVGIFFLAVRKPASANEEKSP